MSAAPNTASETTALLNSAHVENFERAGINNTSGQNIEDAVSEDFETTYKVEGKILFKFSSPLILTYLLQYSYNLVCVYVAGKLGTEELGATSLATMTANVTGLCVYEGLAMCLDTLTSQAYGAGRKKLVGLHVQRMIGLMMVATIPVAALWVASPWILAAIVPEKETARLAGRFLQVYIFGMPFYGAFEAGKRFTQAQGHFSASLVPVAVCAPLNLLWNWLFAFKLNMGFMGAALAMVISNVLQPIVLLIYIRYFMKETHECWPGVSFSRISQNWGTMVRLGVPGILMVLSEWLAFDILTFAASWLGSDELAAQSVLMTVAITMWHIPMPISVAAATRFGNLIGHGALTAARKAVSFYYIVFASIGLFDIVILTALRKPVAYGFSNDAAVRNIIIRILPIVAAAQMIDALAAGVNGLLRGLGKQTIGGWVNLVVYYVWAVPISLFLAFGPAKMGLLGLWIGPLSGLGIVFCAITGYIRLSDWRKAVEEARAREE